MPENPVKPALPEKDESTYRERTIHIERTPWMDVPGETAPPLEPRADHLVKTLPERNVSVYAAELPPPDEISLMTRKYLQVSSSDAENRWLLVLLGPMAATGLVGGAIGVVGMLWLMLFGRGVHLFEGLFAIVSTAVLMWFSWGMLCASWYSYRDEPVRFHRDSGKVYRFRSARRSVTGKDDAATRGEPTIFVYDWASLRAEITRQTLFTGQTFNTFSFLQLAVVDPATGQVTERFRVGNRGEFGDLRGRLFLWESIRRYMEEGPERVPPPGLKTHRGNFLDSFDEFNPVSMMSGFKSWPAWIFGFPLAAMFWLLSGVFMIAALARWIGAHTGRKPSWGELEQTVFKLDADDPAAKNTLDPSIEAPRLWSAETQRRKRALRIWIASMGVQWLLVTAWLHIWPYCSCYFPDSFCLPVKAICPDFIDDPNDITRPHTALPMPAEAPAPAEAGSGERPRGQ
jgi:hypothetical protein